MQSNYDFFRLMEYADAILGNKKKHKMIDPYLLDEDQALNLYHDLTVDRQRWIDNMEQYPVILEYLEEPNTRVVVQREVFCRAEEIDDLAANCKRRIRHLLPETQGPYR